MKRNSKISVALHCIAHLNHSSGPMTSNQLADCCQTNPVVIRRLLAPLKKEGVLHSDKGHNGGWVLNQKLSKITLYDIYTILEEPLFPKSKSKDTFDDCKILFNLNSTMSSFFAEAEAELWKKMKKMKLSEILNV